MQTMKSYVHEVGGGGGLQKIILTSVKVPRFSFVAFSLDFRDNKFQLQKANDEVINRKRIISVCS